MATKTFRLANATDNNFQRMVDGVDQAAATLGTGWVVGKTATANSSEMLVGTERAASTFSTEAGTPKPSGLITGASANAFRSQVPLDGIFANANWTLTLVWRSVTTAHSGTLRVRVRVFKGPNADGSGATELTGSTQVGTTSGVGSTSADVTSTVTWSPGGVLAFAGEYLFVAVAMEIVTASGSNTADADFRTGSGITTGTRVLTSEFYPATRAGFVGFQDPGLF